MVAQSLDPPWQEEHVDPRVQQTIDTMTSQLHKRLVLGELAGAVGLSVVQLTRLFRRDTGTTPGVFLRRLRWERARALLSRTSLPVREVMIQVGISDRSHFARIFSREYGSSPRTFRLKTSRAGAADVRRNMTDRLGVNCPTCGHTAVVSVHTTETGEYWQCEKCARMWYSEGAYSHRTPVGNRRRRRDKGPIP